LSWRAREVGRMMPTLDTVTAEYGRRETEPGAYPVRPWPALGCPHARRPLVEESGQLSCDGGHHFPIVSGIPRFVPATTYADHFGEQWKRYRLTQLDSYTGIPISRDR